MHSITWHHFLVNKIKNQIKMKNKWSVFEINRIIVTYAAYATLMYVVYFIIMRITGLAPHTELRFINYFLFCITGYYALKKSTQERNNRLDYLQGIGIAFSIGALSFIFFAVCVFIYSLFDPFFAVTVLKEFPSGSVFGSFQAPFLVAAEGIGLSSVLALCLMQYFKIFSRRKRWFQLLGKKESAVLQA